MEINLSPALSCDAPLDMQVKSKLIADTFNLIGIKQFDRKKESENKVRNRMKSYNKGLSGKVSAILTPQNDPLLNNIFTLGKISSKPKANGQAMADMYIDDFSLPKNTGLEDQIHILIENQPEFLVREDLLKRLAHTKYKEIIRETLTEDSRKGGYIRIFPQHGTNFYD